MSATISDFWCDTSWKSDLPLPNDVAALVRSVKISNSADDVCCWKLSSNGSFNVKDAYNLVRQVYPSVPWHSFIWKEFLPPSRSLVVWKAIHGKLTTEDLLKLKGFQIASRCALCDATEESIDHIFARCRFTIAVWMALENAFGMSLNSLLFIP
ncbi:RNA-directed DNA polymerase (reverse transcriptase)-related family protein [Euphorbia peplus]|nr:RNA-directed DNA polymerase (reverse transcriptase)-related family protein [Euphorbia peplus]